MIFTEEFLASFVNVARSQVGVREVGNNRGARIRAYQSATWLHPDSWPWCAAFVCWCFRAAAVGFDFEEDLFPQTPRAFELEDWGKRHARTILKPSTVEFGDVVIFGFSHCGISCSRTSEGTFRGIEGNTGPGGSRDGDGVYLKTRKMSLVRSVVRLS